MWDHNGMGLLDLQSIQHRDCFGHLSIFILLILKPHKSRPETQPVISLIYIESSKDLRRLEKAAQDGRFHVTWFLPYVFRDVSLTKNPVSYNNS